MLGLAQNLHQLKMVCNFSKVYFMNWLGEKRGDLNLTFFFFEKIGAKRSLLFASLFNRIQNKTKHGLTKFYKFRNCSDVSPIHSVTYLIGQNFGGQKCWKFGFVSKILSAENSVRLNILFQLHQKVKDGRQNCRYLDLVPKILSAENFVRRKFCPPIFCPIRYISALSSLRCPRPFLQLYLVAGWL